MEHNEGYPIIFGKIYTMYEDGDEEGCKVGVEIHSAGTDKEKVVAILQKYIETDVEQLREMCEDKTWISMYMKQRAECEVIPAEEVVFLDEPSRYDTPAKVVVSRKRSLEAAMGYPDSKVCVLNFASATNPGGGVVNGSNAQEEAICRCSTLFPCIRDEKIKEQFHDKHRMLLKKGELNALYNNDCIYTPDVTVFKTDTEFPKLMPEDKWFQIDVISCAAPNLRHKPSNAMNPDSGDRAVSIKPSELLTLYMKRIRRVLEIAKRNKEEVLILGAFGCGAFQNPPEIVASSIARIVPYTQNFKVIEFAVYCSPQDTRNYDVFKRRLARF